VPMFLDWAALRIASARDETPLPAVRLTALVKGDSPWLDGIAAWDRRFVTAEARQRRDLLADIEARVAGLVGFWREAQGRPPWYFPKTAWAVVKDAVYPKRAARGTSEEEGTGASRSASAAMNAWLPGFGTGERDYAPGYARVLGGDVEFAAGSPELADLVACARQLNAWISLDARDEVPA
jgi:exodeoxyribonuclease V gamma subunit